jgi:hypothetical protein
MMKRFFLMTATVASLLLAGSTARAAAVPWKYNFTPTDSGTGAVLTSIASDTNATTKIILTNENPTNAAGNSDIVATQVGISSSAPAGFPDTFANKSVTLKLNLTDSDSGAVGDFFFTGQFSGEASGSRSSIKFMPTGTQSFTQVLGGNEYTVSFSAYTPPPPSGASLKGSIAYTVEVRPVDIQKAPEPSTMLLAGLGASFMGLGAWRKRRNVQPETV